MTSKAWMFLLRAAAAGLLALPSAQSVSAAPAAIQLERKPLAAFVQGRDALRPAAAVDLSRLREKEVLVTRMRAAPELRAPRRPGAVEWRTPYDVAAQRPDGGVGTATLVAVATLGGLRVEPDGAAYGGELLLGLEDTTDPKRRYPLPSAIQVIVSAPVDRLDPTIVTLASTGEWRSVRLFALAPPDIVAVHLRSPLDAEGLDLALQTARPALSVAISPMRIAGLGLDAATVMVRATGLPHAAGRRVTLAADAGRLEETEVALGEDGTGRTALRSGAVGGVKVVATAGWTPAAATASGRFTAPWSFATWAILGGLAGAVLRRTQASWRRTRRAALAKDLAAGALAGIVMAVLNAVGANVVPVAFSARTGEALVFALGVIGAYWGVPTRRAERKTAMEEGGGDP